MNISWFLPGAKCVLLIAGYLLLWNLRMASASRQISRRPNSIPALQPEKMTGNSKRTASFDQIKRTSRQCSLLSVRRVWSEWPWTTNPGNSSCCHSTTALLVAIPQLLFPRTSLKQNHLAYCLLDESRFRTEETYTPEVHAHVGRTRARRVADDAFLNSESFVANWCPFVFGPRTKSFSSQEQ